VPVAAMKPQYAPWIEVADELLSLHAFAYGVEGPLEKFRASPLRPTAQEVAEWLKSKCAVGRWYWWDKSTLAMRAQEPLNALDRMLGDSAGLYERSRQGRELIARVAAVRSKLAAVQKFRRDRREPKE